MNEPISLQQALSQYLRERGLDNVVKEAEVPAIWNELIGQHAVKSIKELTFENKQLLVHIDSSVWRTELRLRANELRDKINERLNADIVREIIIK
jgi:predicted nucleic acid-binding Zn ribbon protein